MIALTLDIGPEDLQPERAALMMPFVAAVMIWPLDKAQRRRLVDCAGNPGCGIDELAARLNAGLTAGCVMVEIVTRRDLGQLGGAAVGEIIDRILAGTSSLPEFRSVSHLWAACVLAGGLEVFPFDEDELPNFLALAEQFRIDGDKLTSAKAQCVLFNSDEAWRIAPDTLAAAEAAIARATASEEGRNETHH